MADKVNVELLRKTLQHIKDHPDEWDQSEWFLQPSWSCGTTACFAGTALLLSGYRPYWIENCWTHLAAPVDAEHPDAENVPVHSAARDLLGLTDSQATDLFDSTNELPYIEELVEAFIAEAGAESADA